MRAGVRVLLPRNCKSGVAVKQDCNCSAVEGEIWDPEDKQIRVKERSEIPISEVQWSLVRKTLCIDFEPPRVRILCSPVHMETFIQYRCAHLTQTHIKMFKK